MNDYPVVVIESCIHCPSSHVFDRGSAISNYWLWYASASGLNERLPPPPLLRPVALFSVCAAPMPDVLSLLNSVKWNQRNDANILLMRMKESPDMWQQAGTILEQSQSQHTRFIGLQVGGRG